MTGIEMFSRIPDPLNSDPTTTTASSQQDDTINLTADADWWLNAIEEDTFNSPLPFDASEGGLWNGKFVPPPPRPPFLDETVSSDGLTTCDLCTWAWREKNAYSLDGSIETAGELGWALTLIIVSVISALLGAIIMVIVFRCRRYKRKSLPEMPKCEHKNSSSFKCRQVKTHDAYDFSSVFYKSSSKQAQDAFILKNCKIDKPCRTDRNSRQGARKGYSVQYNIRTRSKLNIKVCQNTFLNILGVTKSRVRNLCKRHFETGGGPTERRGGDRRSQRNESNKRSIIEYIQKYKTLEVHYCRSKISKRQYLSGDLSINKMWRIYNKENPDNFIKSSYFRLIFNNYFNLGFKTPATDMCSICLQYKERQKIERNSVVKQDLMIKQRIHKLRSKAFFALLNEETEGLLTISFDCQKNMPLPKVADQAAYYSRQLYVYLFGMVVGTGHSALKTDNVFLYYWTENVHAKGSNEIASAVYHRLCHMDLTNIDTIRLVADGCGGQNKNSVMVGMCEFFLFNMAPPNVSKIELIFPIPGHSYIPPDRVFAQIEKKVKAKETIVELNEYLNIYKEHGTLISLGSDECPALDFKSEVTKIIKPPSGWHFKFNQCKRFILTKYKRGIIQVRGEPFYKSDIGEPKSNIKRGENLTNMAPVIIPNGVKVKEAKISDVDKLLQKHFGSEWRCMQNLNFYKNIIDSNNYQIELVDDDVICCNNMEVDDVLRI